MNLKPVALAAAAVTCTLSLTAQAQTQSQTPAEQISYIHAGALLVRAGEKPRKAATIVIHGDKIDSIHEGFLNPPSGVRFIDLRKQFVMPGLIDMHVHILHDGDKMRPPEEQSSRTSADYVLLGLANARRTLEAGFTTIRDVGSEIRSVTALRDAINKGLVEGPTIYTSGRVIAVTAGHGAGNADAAEHVCDGADDCRRAVRTQIALGADLIKFAATGGVTSDAATGLTQQMFADEMRAIVETAHMFGRKVAAHAHGKQGIKAALEAGVDSIEHGIYTDAETNLLFKRTGAWLVPTLCVPDSVLAQARAGARSPVVLAKVEEAAAVHAKNAAAAIRDGVKVAFGTDAGVREHGKNADEFNHLLKAGMTSADAIRAATIDAATLLGKADRIATIEKGKDADIIAVAASPIADISELERVEFVMRRGVVHKMQGTRQVFPQ